MKAVRKNSEESRAHDRVDCKTEALIETKGIKIRGEVENLSLKGLFVRTKSQLPLDETAKVTVFFNGESAHLSFSMDARVARVDSDGIGLTFKRIDVNSLLLKNLDDLEKTAQNCKRINEEIERI